MLAAAAFSLQSGLHQTGWIVEYLPRVTAMELSWTEEEEMLAAETLRFGEEVAKPQAELADRQSSLQDEVVKAAWDFGLGLLLVEENRGGAGQRWAGAGRCIAAVAQFDASLAYVLARHNKAAAIIGDAWTPDMGLALLDKKSGYLSIPTFVTHVVTIEDKNWSLYQRPEGGTADEDTLGLRACQWFSVPPNFGVALASGNITDSFLQSSNELEAFVALGVAEAAYRSAVAYAEERKQFGRSIRDFPGIAKRLAESQLFVEKIRALAMAQRGSGCNLAKWAQQVAAHAIQIHGGNGFVREYLVERYARDAEMLAYVSA